MQALHFKFPRTMVANGTNGKAATLRDINTNCWSGPYPSSQSNSFEVDTNISNPKIGDWLGISFVIDLAEVRRLAALERSRGLREKGDSLGAMGFAKQSDWHSPTPSSLRLMQPVTGGIVNYTTVSPSLSAIRLQNCHYSDRLVGDSPLPRTAGH